MARRRSPRRATAAGARALAVAALAGVVSCAAHELRPGEPREVQALAIAPYAFHEECVRLEQDERLDYRYASSEPLDFNIHYHESGAVLAPVVRERSTGDTGTFEAPGAQDYCLMWQAGAAGAMLSYRVLLRNARR